MDSLIPLPSIIVQNNILNLGVWTNTGWFLRWICTCKKVKASIPGPACALEDQGQLRSGVMHFSWIYSRACLCPGRPRPAQIRCNAFLMDSLISFPYIIVGNNLHNSGRTGSDLPAPDPWALEDQGPLKSGVIPFSWILWFPSPLPSIIVQNNLLNLGV